MCIQYTRPVKVGNSLIMASALDCKFQSLAKPAWRMERLWLIYLNGCNWVVEVLKIMAGQPVHP